MRLCVVWAPTGVAQAEAAATVASGGTGPGSYFRARSSQLMALGARLLAMQALHGCGVLVANQVTGAVDSTAMSRLDEVATAAFVTATDAGPSRRFTSVSDSAGRMRAALGAAWEQVVTTRIMLVNPRSTAATATVACRPVLYLEAGETAATASADSLTSADDGTGTVGVGGSGSGSGGAVGGADAATSGAAAVATAAAAVVAPPTLGLLRREGAARVMTERHEALLVRDAEVVRGAVALDGRELVSPTAPPAAVIPLPAALRYLHVLRSPVLPPLRMPFFVLSCGLASAGVGVGGDSGSSSNASAGSSGSGAL